MYSVFKPHRTPGEVEALSSSTARSRLETVLLFCKIMIAVLRVVNQMNYKRYLLEYCCILKIKHIHIWSVNQLVDWK